MSLTLISQVEAELAKNAVTVVEAWKADFGNGRVFYWSNQTITASASFDSNEYEARVKQVSTLPFSVGAKDDKGRLTAWNGDRFFTKLINEGVIFGQARLTCHRMFPNIAAPNNVIQNYWHGRVKKYTISESACEFELGFGFVNLKRRALRRWEHTCNNNFADGLHCPYDPLNGKGLPENRFRGAATGGSATTITGRNFEALGVQVGWLAFVETKKIIGVITDVSGTTITVDSWRNGGPAASGDAYVIGPAFTKCPFTKTGCNHRGMNGPVGGSFTAAKLNISTRRYYAGFLAPRPVPFSVRPEGESKSVRRTSSGNQGIAGSVIPLCVGRGQIRGMPILGVAAAGQYLHFLAAIQGRIYDFGRGVRANGFYLDDVNYSKPLVQQQESFMVWGTDSNSSGNDSSSTDLTTDQKKQAIGSRQSVAIRRFTTLDTYSQNPFLFNRVSGDGVSLSGLAAIRGRIEAEANNNSIPDVSAPFIGIMTKMMPGSSPQADDRNVTDWTKFPNHMQLGYWFSINTQWGAGFSETDLDLVQFRAMSDYCQEKIPASQARYSTLFNGTVGFGPDEAEVTVTQKNWIWLSSPSFYDRTPIGETFTTTEIGKEFQAIVVGLQRYKNLPKIADTENGPIVVPDANEGEEGAFVFLDTDFPSGKVPVATDTVLIQSVTRVHRFKANGILDQDSNVGEMLEQILKNCNGTFVQKAGKIYPVIRKAVSLSVVDALPVFTDKGANRNIIRSKGGESTLKWNPDPEPPNSIVVEFDDQMSGYAKVSLVIRNQAAQESLGNRFGEKRRDKKEANLGLALTNNRDQAARLGALALREKGPIAPDKPNGTIKWVSPVHDAQKLVPVEDVYPIASDHLPAYIQHVRIMKITDNADKATMTIEARPYFTAQYDDTAEDMSIQVFAPDQEFDDDELPLDVKVESAVERVVTAKDGSIESVVDIEFTLPS